MEFALPVDEMTTKDKLSAMELLWDNLCRRPEDIPSPHWHGDTLSVREKRVREGKAKFADLDQVKDRVRKASL